MLNVVLAHVNESAQVMETLNLARNEGQNVTWRGVVFRITLRIVPFHRPGPRSCVILLFVQTSRRKTQQTPFPCFDQLSGYSRSIHRPMSDKNSKAHIFRELGGPLLLSLHKNRRLFVNAIPRHSV